MIELDAVTAAAERLLGVASRTPVITSRTLNERTGAAVFVKAESFQRAGAFKFRGAYNKTASLPPEALARGVIALSSGNHAQALALAARLCGTRALILMPNDAPETKVAATRGYGADVVRFDRYSVEFEELLARTAAERNMVVVHPFDDAEVMAGQGTAALELLDVAGPLDMLLVPVGGGGLISGCATAVKALLPQIRVVGVEPAAGDDVRRSLLAGRRIRIKVPRTIADGQQLPIPGARTFEVMRARVDEVVTVTDPQIVNGMVFLFERMKLVVEPSGASALAALLAGIVEARGLRVGVILSGGNIGRERFSALVDEARSS
jgi:threonine dehydratase